MIYLLLIVFLVLVDQISKFLVKGYFAFGQRYPVIHDFFYLTNINNKGAAWGMFQGGKWVFIILTVVVVVIMGIFMVRNRSFAYRLPLSLVISGAVGNMIDRLFRPEGVCDFLEFHFGSYVFPVFNFADICVTVGAFILIFVILLGEKHGEHDNGEADEADDAADFSGESDMSGESYLSGTAEETDAADAADDEDLGEFWNE